MKLTKLSLFLIGMIIVVPIGILAVAHTYYVMKYPLKVEIHGTYLNISGPFSTSSFSNYKGLEITPDGKRGRWVKE